MKIMTAPIYKLLVCKAPLISTQSNQVCHKIPFEVSHKSKSFKPIHIALNPKFQTIN